MYLSLKWLKELVEIPSSLDPVDLGQSLTMHTVEIDGVESQAKKFQNVVTAKVLAVEPHPNADKLQVAQVDVGEKKTRSIVCGASNLDQGQSVVVALPGAELSDGSEIKEAKVRGEISEGMICAEDELGLGSDHDGIMVLEKNVKPGQNLADFLGLDDTIFEVDNKSITNRPDLWGHVGLAREIACFSGLSNTKFFSQIVENEISKTGEGDIEVKVNNFKLCPRYMALKVDNIKVAESPEWMQKRLTAVGVRPVNNIVDITNYIMLELGQPMHAFDSKIIEKIEVREAKEGEKITTLDGEERELPQGTLLINNQEGPIAIAGIMGGENSEINEETTSIILESANFEPVQVRKSSQKIGLRSESSMRFEKSLDPYLAELGLARASQMLEQICPEARISSEAIDIHDTKKENFGLYTGPIELDVDWLNKRLGKEIEKGKVVKILEGLGFSTKETSENKLEVTIPTQRATKDISIKEDLLEEVARIYGYENIELKYPLVTLERVSFNEDRNLERKVKDVLSTGLKMTEVYNYSFVGEEKVKKLGLDPSDYIRLANPLTSELTLLRQNLITNLLDNIKFNQSRYSEISIFELGRVHLDIPGDVNKDSSSEEVLPYEEKRMALMEAGERKKDLFSSVKGKVENLFDHFDLKIQYLPGETFPNWAEERVFAHIVLSGKNVGFVTKINKKTLNNLGIKKEVVIADISWPQFLEAALEKPRKQCRPQNRYPSVVRDLAFVVDSKILYNDIREEIENFREIIEKVELFDVYQGEKLGKNKRSLAFHITYRSPERTLKSEEVEQLQTELIKRLESKFGAQIRDF